MRHDRNDRRDRYQGQQQDRNQDRQDRSDRQQYGRGSQQQWGQGRRSSSTNEDRYQSRDWNRNEGDSMDYPTSRSDNYDQWAGQPQLNGRGYQGDRRSRYDDTDRDNNFGSTYGQQSGQHFGAGQHDYGYGSTQESRDFRNISEDRYQGAMDFGSHTFNPSSSREGTRSASYDRDYDRGYDSTNYDSPSYQAQQGRQTGYRSGQEPVYGTYGQSSGSSSYGQGGSYGQQRGRFSGRGPKGYKRSDDRIKEDISEMIMRHDEIDGSDIEVEVSSGEVTLTGSVPDRQMKHRVESLIESSLGVSDVNNQLRVKKSTDSSQGWSQSSSSGERSSDRSAEKSASSEKSDADGSGAKGSASKKAASSSTTNPSH